MIKTHFVFAVSFVALMAVSSAWANAPATGESVGTAHTVYTNQTPTSGDGIAGVSYVNKAVNKAGASAQAAEAHAAAAGASALNAAKSAAEAAVSAETANKALATKADKSELSNYVTTAEFGAVSNAQSELIGAVTDLTTQVGDLENDKQNKLTAGTNITIIGNTISAKDTTYSTGNATTSGLTKLYTGTGTNTDGTMTQNAIKSALDAKQGTLTAGSNITISNGTISAKDTVYTLPTATADTLGGVKVDTALSSTSENPVQNKVINSALSNKLDKTAKAASATTADSATKATQDASGNVITSTYATKSELTSGLSGKQATLTTSNIKGSGSVSVAISDGVITVSGTDNNTTYSTGNATTSGLTKLYTATGSNTDGTMTQKAINDALAGKLSTSGTAAKATADASGNTITSTYATKSELTSGLSGKQATLTTSNIKGSGSVSVAISDGVITVSGTDNNTTYGTGNATTSGLTKLYTGTGTNTDGTMTQNAIKSALDAKQGTLTAGSNITISNGTISATDTNTTYSTGNATTSGLTKLYTATGSNTDGTMTQKAINDALAGKLSTSGTAAKATADASGNTITSTYATKAELNALSGTAGTLSTDVASLQAQVDGLETDKQAKLTAGSNITIFGSTISATDTNTTYSAGTNMSLSGTTFSVATGTPSTLGVVKVGQIPSGSATSTTYATIWVE